MMRAKTQHPQITYHINEQTYHISYQNNTPIIKDNLNSTIEPAQFRAKLFGFVFQKHYLHPNFTIEQNIKIPLLATGQEEKNDVTNIPDLVRRVNLVQENFHHKYPDEISGGQGQRVAILRGIIKDSPILIGDELTNSLDKPNAREVLGKLKTHQSHQQEQVFIWVTHDIHLTTEFSDKVLVLRDGNMVTHGIIDTPQDDKELLALLSDDGKQ